MRLKWEQPLVTIGMVIALTACGGGCGGEDGAAGSSGGVSPPGTTIVPPPSNSVPVANAGALQNVVIGEAVTLDDSGSTDADGDMLTHAWTLTNRPSGSVAAISDPSNVRPNFVADVVGTYTASLTVNDGKADSPVATVTVTVTASSAGVAPVASAGQPQSVVVGTAVTLDGSGSSDANGNTLTYAWTLTSRPPGSAAALADATSVKPTFLADVAGTYVASLVVSDGTAASQSASVEVSAAVANVAPVANAVLRKVS